MTNPSLTVPLNPVPATQCIGQYSAYLMKVITLISLVHFCGQLAPTSHAYKLISTYACQAMKKVSGEPLGLEPGTPASEIGSLPIDFQYPPYIWL